MPQEGRDQPLPLATFEVKAQAPFGTQRKPLPFGEGTSWKPVWQRPLEESGADGVAALLETPGVRTRLRALRGALRWLVLGAGASGAAMPT